MTYCMLFKNQAEALDAPMGVHVAQHSVNALCVFSSYEAGSRAKDRAPGGEEFYVEAVLPDDVVSLCAVFGVGVVALDPYVAESATLMKAVDAVQVLTELEI